MELSYQYVLHNPTQLTDPDANMLETMRAFAFSNPPDQKLWPERLEPGTYFILAKFNGDYGKYEIWVESMNSVEAFFKQYPKRFRKALKLARKQRFIPLVVLAGDESPKGPAVILAAFQRVPVIAASGHSSN